jgi:hypothetical protein
MSKVFWAVDKTVEKFIYFSKMSHAGLEEKLADFYHRQNELIDSFLAVPGQVGEQAK